MESSLPSSQILDSGESAERKNEAKNYSEVMSTLPKVKGLNGYDYYLYQGFWYDPFFLEGIMSVQERFNSQSTDIFVASFPKTGTTWLKALTFAIFTRSRLSGSTTSPLLTKTVFHFWNMTLLETRVIGTWQFLWDAKDAFVSLWYFLAKLQGSENVEPLPLEEAFEFFCSGIASYGPYWDHVLEYWRASLEFPEKILFLTYEEMKKDTAAHVKKLAEFMGCSFTLEEEEEREVQKIISMCSFEKLSSLEVNKNGKRHLDTSIPIPNSVFFRKGEIGDWANHLTPEMGARLDDIMEKKLKGSGLKLPR